MGELRVARVAGGDEVTPEFVRLNRRFRDDTGFLIARLLRVCRLGMEEALDDLIVGETNLYAYQSGPAVVIYSVRARPVADQISPIPLETDAVMLAFGDVRAERFSAILQRAKRRDP